MTPTRLVFIVKLTMTIGYVENYIRDDLIVLWFYRRTSRINKATCAVDEIWKRVESRRVTPKQRSQILTQILENGAGLIDLGRGI